jgi:hypothetical protein
MLKTSYFPWLRRILPISLLLVLSALAAPVYANQLDILILGLEGPMLENVLARVQPFNVTGNTRLSRKRREKLQSDAESRASSALRPFGYYHAEVSSKMRSTGNGNWELVLQIDKGPPVIVTASQVEIQGAGSSENGLLNWKATWPLKPGVVLNQVTWDEQKTEAL